MRAFNSIVLTLCLMGCNDAPAPAGSTSADTSDATGDTVDGDVLNVHVFEPIPAIFANDAWREAESCDETNSGWDCVIPLYGRVAIEATGSGHRATFHTNSAMTIEGIRLRGTVDLPGATSWLSNGFQSWSQSGMVALGALADDDALATAAAQTDDAEVLRRGDELSWFYTAVGGGDEAMVFGALTADRLKPWVAVGETGDGIEVQLISGWSGESLSITPGETLESEIWHWARGADAVELLETYGRALNGHLAETDFEAEAGWNSWYDLWAGVDEAAMRANAELAGDILSPLLPSGAPPLRIVIDDGWQERWGEWTPNDKFPSGLDGLAADLRGDGFTMGVWLAPLLVDADSELVTDHPDWFVGGAFYDKPDAGRLMILDVTHPDAAAHLTGVIETIVGWGYDFLKIDFLFAGTFEGERNQEMTGLEAYHRALALIREAAGEDVFILAVGAPPHPSLPYVDGWRLGPDIALQVLGPGFAFIANEARAISARWHLCYAVLCDADPPLLRDLPQTEVEAGAWTAALAGGALFLSDDLRALPDARHAWGLSTDLVAAAIGNEPLRPVDVFPDDPPDDLVNGMDDFIRRQLTHVVPALWELPDGRRLGLNTTDAELTVEGHTLAPRSAGLLEER